MLEDSFHQNAYPFIKEADTKKAQAKLRRGLEHVSSFVFIKGLLPSKRVVGIKETATTKAQAQLIR